MSANPPVADKQVSHDGPSEYLFFGSIRSGNLKVAELLIHRQDCRRVLNLVSSRNVGGIRNHRIGAGIWGGISFMVRGIPPECQKFLQMRQKRGCPLSPTGGWRCRGAGAVAEGARRAFGEGLPEMRPNCPKMSLKKGFKGSWSADHDPMGGWQ